MIKITVVVVVVIVIAQNSIYISTVAKCVNKIRIMLRWECIYKCWRITYIINRNGSFWIFWRGIRALFSSIIRMPLNGRDPMSKTGSYQTKWPQTMFFLSWMRPSNQLSFFFILWIDFLFLVNGHEHLEAKSISRIFYQDIFNGYELLVGTMPMSRVLCQDKRRWLVHRWK